MYSDVVHDGYAFLS